ncbi:pyruvate dehydrogenase (acetyl-transferring) E1 component subunit alpha [Photobacterium leiognathi]|uniref:pyruvate dehydrogenase (acetyl-transferring) E1 component subunit alpha n=1 Tax=Photobacterium leiognathi TaxID=553611 RepID=UPI0027334579|nr:pyruvate dehydrogenase (acetyl-transferring) E1 component subunit alpha [Photobacterium leiognathi]
MTIQTQPMHRYIDHCGKLINPLPDWASNELLLRFYRDMVLVRHYDKKAIALQRTGKLGTYPSHLGAEAIGIAIGHAMEPTDTFAPYYRDMPALWARGVSMEKNLQYWGGDELGSDFPPTPNQSHNDDMPFCVPIATQCSHAVGIAAAMKIKGSHRATVVTCGDGATSKGDFLESLNCAGIWNIPLVFVINNNQWAISVPLHLQCHAEHLVDKAKGAGIEGMLVDGNDIIAMYDAMLYSLDKAKKGKGATLIEAISYRLCDHTTADDASRYRSDDELEQAWQYDPVARLKTYLINQGLWSEEQEIEWQHECDKYINDAVEHYLALIAQAPESTFDHLYEHIDDDLQHQRDSLINKALRMEKQSPGGEHG